LKNKVWAVSSTGRATDS